MTVSMFFLTLSTAGRVEKQVNETFSNPAADSWNEGDKDNKFSISNVYHVQANY